MNQLRTLVKTDTRPVWQLAELTGLHPNTISKLIAPNFLPATDPRPVESMAKLAAVYGLGVRVKVEFYPLDGDSPVNPADDSRL